MARAVNWLIYKQFCAGLYMLEAWLNGPNRNRAKRFQARFEQAQNRPFINTSHSSGFSGEEQKAAEPPVRIIMGLMHSRNRGISSSAVN